MTVYNQNQISLQIPGEKGTYFLILPVGSNIDEALKKLKEYEETLLTLKEAKEKEPIKEGEKDGTAE